MHYCEKCCTIAIILIFKHFEKSCTIVKNVATIAKNVATIDTTIATIASGLLRFKSTCNLRYTWLDLMLDSTLSVVAGIPEREEGTIEH